MSKSKQKRTAVRHLSETLSRFLSNIVKTILIAAVCLWLSLNLKVEYDGSRALKTVEKVGDSWIGKTVEGVKSAIEVAKVVK